MKAPAIFALAAIALTPGLYAQDFGFGETSAQSPAAAPAPAVTIGGSLRIEATAFPSRSADDASFVPSGVVTLSAGGASVDASLRLKLSEAILSESPADAFDTVSLRLYAGPLLIEGGLLKVTWGKADSLGPLNVLNPLDHTDLTVTDELELRIAMPMLRLAWDIGADTRVELVGLPGFKGTRIDYDGLWTPAKIQYIKTAYGVTNFNAPDTERLAYAQAGTRLTTSLSGIDLGLQYFYGYLPTPALNVVIPNAYLSYNRYHQAGLDLATVLAGFNLRAELAANVTDDISGDDPLVYNPHLAWSLGFDHGLFWGLSLNLQGSGTYRLADDGIASPLDIEAASDVTHTRITGNLSRGFLRDTLNLKLSAIYGVEDGDCMIVPSAELAVGDGVIGLSGGWFGGNESGELGQYRDNGWVRLKMRYEF